MHTHTHIYIYMYIYIYIYICVYIYIRIESMHYAHVYMTIHAHVWSPRLYLEMPRHIGSKGWAKPAPRERRNLFEPCHCTVSWQVHAWLENDMCWSVKTFQKVMTFTSKCHDYGSYSQFQTDSFKNQNPVYLHETTK